MSEHFHVVIVGGGLAGGRTCAALRSGGFTGTITLVGDEPHPPYDRPPLSKGVLRYDEDPDLGIDFSALGVTTRLGARATGVDLEEKVLHTDRGEEPYDNLVIATGSRPLTVPGKGQQLTLRTKEEAAELVGLLADGAEVALIGAGWIGAEVATAALAAGSRVRCLEMADAPLSSALGSQVSERFLPWWGSVDLEVGVGVSSVDREGVRMHDGRVLTTDACVTGIGVRPTTDWLTGTGLRIVNGAVAVDADRRTSDPSVYAVGDVATRWSPRLEDWVHPGHWDEASSGAALAASAILGTPRGTDDVPYFWSDQFGHKIQYVGQHRRSDRLILRDHPDHPHRWGAAWFDDGGRMTAHLSVDFPKAMVQGRKAILDGHPVDPLGFEDIRTAPSPPSSVISKDHEQTRERGGDNVRTQ